jgi:hypothetical protein
MVKIKFYNLEIIVLFLIIGGSLFAASMLVKEDQNITKKASGGQGSLSLPAQRNVEVGNEFSLPVMLDTDGESITAVDVVINFNRSDLELTDISPRVKIGSLETFMPLDSGGSFRRQEVINKANSEGKIAFGAAAFRWNEEKVLGGFNGLMGQSNPLAILKFKPKRASQGTEINFNFTPGSTTDSNLVSGTADILSQVTNCRFSTGGNCKPCPDGSFEPKNTTSFNCKTNGSENIDYGMWAQQFYDIAVSGENVPPNELYGDYNCDGEVNVLDHQIWYVRWCPTEHSNCQ